MTWAVPLAGLVVLGVVGPLLAHLLSRRPPSPRLFPTLRFLTDTPTSARQVRTLHDPVLWALRTLIVIVVAGAAAGPTLVTGRRQAAWQAPVLRATVVGAGVAVPARDEETGTDGELRWTYSGRSLRADIAAALRDLEAHTDTRREIVVRWDGARRMLGPADLGAIPAAIGIRLEVVDVPRPTVPGHAGGAIDIDAAPDEATARDYVLHTVPWTSSDGVRVVWPRAAERAAVERDATAPSASTAALFTRMRLDPRLRDAAQRSRLDAAVVAVRDDRLPRNRFEPLARSATGDVLLWGAALDERPVLVLDARPRDPLALWSLRVADESRRSLDGWPQPDTRWSAAELRAAHRPPAPAPPGPLPGGLDTRWWWLAALALVLLEGALRRVMLLPGAQPAETSETLDAA